MTTKQESNAALQTSSSGLDAIQDFCKNNYLTRAHKRKRSSRCNTTPRWHNQSFMLYLALRHHTESNTMARTDLIRAALEWDVKLSEEHLLPKVFRGKTPMNSASAVLSNNTDGYFVPLRPEGSRSMHFKLSFEPGHYHSSWEQYKDWQLKLTTMDWPYYFGRNDKQHKEQHFCDIENLLSIYPTEFDEFLAKRKRQKILELEHSQKKAKLNDVKENKPPLERRRDHVSLVTTDHTDDGNELPNCGADNVTIPKSWKDLFFVNNDGVFAKQYIPSRVPIGFYFGVPRTEDEFDALKEGRGKAERYAMMYGKSAVIDPTDAEGNLYGDKGDNNEPLCPFYYIKETDTLVKANIVFCEGLVRNQIVCWTMKDIAPGEELYTYEPTATQVMTINSQ